MPKSAVGLRQLLKKSVLTLENRKQTITSVAGVCHGTVPSFINGILYYVYKLSTRSEGEIFLVGIYAFLLYSGIYSLGLTKGLILYKLQPQVQDTCTCAQSSKPIVHNTAEDPSMLKSHCLSFRTLRRK